MGFGASNNRGDPGFIERNRGAKGEAKMADIEMAAVDAAEPTDAEGCFARGMIYSAGVGVAVDLIEAHKWFNIAAMRGHGDGARLRREIAEQMSDAEIGCAQRAARGWLKAHPQEPAAPRICAAA
jgi:TPR repeat protein